MDDSVARRLLRSTEQARIACIALDGTPRLNPMLFRRTGAEIVLPCFATAAIYRPIRANSVVAIIDSAGPSPQVLQLRGSSSRRSPNDR